MPSSDPITKQQRDNEESERLLNEKLYDDDGESRAEKVITCSGRMLLVWLSVFVFMVSYQSSIFTFGQFVYIKLQKQSFPNFTAETTKSICDTNTSSVEYEIQVDVQEQAATWSIYFYMSGGLTSIIANFVLGAYTDRFGRKFLFILPCCGTLIRTGLFTILMKINAPLYYYIIGYFIEGCTGQIFTIFQAAFIYVSDITKPGKPRSFAMVAIEIAFGLGAAFPAVATGYLLKETDNFLLPMYISSGLLVVALFLMSTLPETFTKEVRAKRHYVSFYDNLKDATDLYFSKKNYGRRWMYSVMLAVLGLTTYVVFGRVAVEGLYLLNTPFCFGPEEIGVFNSLKLGLQQIVGIVLVAIFLTFTSDEVVAVIGCISYLGASVMEAVATSKLVLYLVAVVGCCGLLTIPMARSIMSQMTSPQKQGAVFASISAAETMINLISAVSSNTIYLTTVSIYRGFIFFVYAAFNGICILLMVVFMVGSRSTKKKYNEIEHPN